MTTSNGIRKKFFFQGKVFNCGRWHSKHTFHEDFPCEQEDEEQQPPVEQNKNKEQQDLLKATPEIHQDAETPSKRTKRKQNDATLGQPTT